MRPHLDVVIVELRHQTLTAEYIVRIRPGPLTLCLGSSNAPALKSPPIVTEMLCAAAVDLFRRGARLRCVGSESGERGRTISGKRAGPQTIPVLNVRLSVVCPPHKSKRPKLATFLQQPEHL